MQSRGERGCPRSGAPRPCPGQEAGAKAAPKLPLEGAASAFLSVGPRWVDIPFWHVLRVRLQTQLVPKGPSASPPHQAALYGTTLAPRSFALRPVSPSCCLLTIQPEATSCPICLCLSLNWSSPPPRCGAGLGRPLPRLTHPAQGPSDGSVEHSHSPALCLPGSQTLSREDLANQEEKVLLSLPPKSQTDVHPPSLEPL